MSGESSEWLAADERRKAETLRHLDLVLIEFMQSENLTPLEVLSLVVSTAADLLGHSGLDHVRFRHMIAAFIESTHEARAEHERECLGSRGGECLH